MVEHPRCNERYRNCLSIIHIYTQRVLFVFLHLLGVPRCEIHHSLCATYGENNVYKVHTVYYWADQFAKGRTNLSNSEQSGRPSNILNDEIINIMQTLLAEYRRYMLDNTHYKIATKYPYITPASSRSLIFRILTVELEMCKVSARWILRQLLPHHPKTCFQSALEFLPLYNRRGNALLNQIVTSNETWVHYWMSETKQASLQWKGKGKGKGEKTPRKFKTHPSVGKVMVSVFWDNKGILQAEYFPKTQNVNLHTYFDTFIKLH